MQSICRSGTLSAHLAESVTKINSLATNDRPNKAGKPSIAVKRMSLRNTRNWRSSSPSMAAITGWATCKTMSEMKP